MRTALYNARGSRTQTEVANELQTTQKYISLLELGKRIPSLTFASKISKYYGLPVETLFPDVFLSDQTTKCSM